MSSRPRACKKNISYVEANNVIADVKEKKESRDKLYEVEIVERDQINKRIKLHYVGYGKNFDEWHTESPDELCPVSKISKITIPSSSNLDERKQIFLEDIKIKIQKHLVQHRSTDPLCKFEVDGSKDVFDVILEACELKHHNRSFYSPTTLKHLENLLGSRWFLRIENQKGDFCYIREGTFKLWVFQPKGLTSYQKYGEKYIEHIQEQRPVLKVSFVRTRGNKRLYMLLEKDF